MKSVVVSLFFSVFAVVSFAQVTTVNAGVGETIYRWRDEKVIQNTLGTATTVTACHRDKSLTLVTLAYVQSISYTTMVAHPVRVSVGDIFVLSDHPRARGTATVISIDDCRGTFRIEQLR